MNPVRVWRDLQRVDKRTLEGKMAKAFWRKFTLGIAKIGLGSAFLILVLLSVIGWMPPELGTVSASLRTLYKPEEWTTNGVLFGGGLAGISLLSVLWNTFAFSDTVEMLEQSIKIAKRHAPRKRALPD